MARVQTIQIQGLRELKEALDRLPDRVAKNSLRTAVYAAARVIRNEARMRAPIAEKKRAPDGHRPGTLRRSIIMKHIRELSGRTHQTFFVTVRHGKKYRNQGKKKNLSQDAWYWRFIEFGTVKMAARPFLRPALYAKRAEAVAAMKFQLAARIESEARRLKSRAPQA